MKTAEELLKSKLDGKITFYQGKASLLWEAFSLWQS